MSVDELFEMAPVKDEMGLARAKQKFDAGRGGRSESGWVRKLAVAAALLAVAGIAVGAIVLSNQSRAPWATSMTPEQYATRCITPDKESEISASDARILVQASTHDRERLIMRAGQYIIACSLAEQGGNIGSWKEADIVPVPAGAVDRKMWRDGADGGGTELFGVVGSDVRAVTFVQTDGSEVHAVVKGGFFIAWWGGAESLNSKVLATMADGSVVTLGSVKDL